LGHQRNGIKARRQPQLSIQKLEVFCCVVEAGGVTRASEILGVAQPAVTAQLRDIEDKVGVALVQRNGRQIVLTEAGQRFHHWCEEMLIRTSEMMRELGSLAGGASGTAIVAASMTVGSYVLGDLLATFQRQYPNTRITTQIGNTSVATESVRAGACDFGVLLLDTQQDLTGLELEKLWDERLVLIAARDEDRIEQQASVDDLMRLPFVTSPSALLRRELEDNMLYAQDVLHRNVVLELGHPEAIKRAIRAKAGFAFIEETAVRPEIENGDLRVVKTPAVQLTMPLHLARRRGKLLTPMHRRLMEFIKFAQPVGMET
jgi:LysR family transcriptional regulator, low CO2-responsive transcriptional regulator